MVENSPFDVSAQIRRLGPNFKDSIALYGLSCVFLYHQIKVDEPLLHATANYQVLTWHVFHFNGVELCPLSQILVLSWVNRRLTISSSLPWVGISPLCCKLCQVSLLLWQIGCTSLANSTLAWFLHTFFTWPFLWMNGQVHTFFVPFAYMHLQGTSWSKGYIVWTSECAWWFMS